ncbi:hypothetical protein U8607_02545 [Methylobacterium durans]|uniref:hypothetical protein n=1 Tax=Methylobacterium durans TaxID=2202825 RepID=UPI002AFF9EDF|nr:hypothetical protein [Methylobacterium durans]MEA1830950.1 hypothetical protein [Methylobacterium durans]
MLTHQPTDTAPTISVVLSDDLLDAVEYLRRISSEPTMPSRSQVVRDLLAIALMQIFCDDEESFTAYVD